MKVEIGESLGYSFLRHVEGCWLVQANWKASGHWPRLLNDAELDREFAAIRRNVERDFQGAFRGTTKGTTFLRQAEIDVVGIRLDGGIYTVEVAFHEDGLRYGSADETVKNVLKKMLRTMLILRAYHPEDTERHIYFASPRVTRGVQGGLEQVFAWLYREYPVIDWQLLTNNRFRDQFLRPLRERTHQVADTSELFVRSLQLLELMGQVNLDNAE